MMKNKIKPGHEKPESGARLGRLLALIGVTGLLAGAPSCIVVVEGAPPECETDVDCANRADGATHCSASKVCVQPDTAGACTTNQQCLDADPNKICRKSDSTCVPLKTTECQTVEGDPSRDDSFMIGSVLPTTGLDEVYGKPVELAIQLALSEIQAATSGLPTATPGVSRPILFIGCGDDSGSDPDAAIRAAVHLSEELQVPAIIGEAFSGSTLMIANEVTIQNGTLLISPSATSEAITTLQDNGLVWRTSAPDSLQADALKLYVPEVESMVRTDFMMNGLPSDTPVKLAMMHNKDLYAKSLAERMLASTGAPQLQINGAGVQDPANVATYLQSEYDEQDVTSQVSAAKQAAEVFHPNIVILFGFYEVASIITVIETKWTGDPALRPRYVLADAALGSDLALAIGADASLRARVTGSLAATTSMQYSAFVDRYDAKYPSEKDAYPASVFGAAGGYDAVLIAYASATLNGDPETGQGLALGMQKLSNPAGPLVNTGTSGFSAGFPVLMGSGSIDYNGASGPLNFNPATGEAASDIQIWCMPAAPGGTGNAKSSGRFYDAATATLVGAYTPCN